MAFDTRERILNAALDMFSEYGCDASNIQSIADSVGIVKSALYRHFESKEEIRNAVFDMMIAYYEEHFGSADKIQNIPQTVNELFEMTMKMVNFTVHDEKVIKIRKIILTEQFRDEKARRLATRYFIDDTAEIFEGVFKEMMQAGSIKQADAGFLAFSYTAPITALIHLCDREPKQISQTKARIENFVKEFIKIYGTNTDVYIC